MNTLQDLEKEFNFTYPALYRQLYDDKMLDWGRMVTDGIKIFSPL